MKDLHTHILPGVDDGSSSLEVTSNLIKKLTELGFTDIVLTPHYYPKYKMTVNNKGKLEIFNSLQKMTNNINLYLGNEIIISDNIVEKIIEGEIYPINNTKYLLIEFPFDIFFPVINDYIDKLYQNGYKVILAHPERYIYYQENPEFIKTLIDKGVLLQCNYGSIINYYGPKSKKCLKYFLKNNYVDVLSLDLHSDYYILDNFKKIKKKIIKLTSEDKFKTLTDTNIEKIINNEKV